MIRIDKYQSRGYYNIRWDIPPDVMEVRNMTAVKDYTVHIDSKMCIRDRDGKPLSEYGGYCPVQLIWQHPEEALNPRLKMKHALKQGGGVSPRIAEGLGIQDEWLERYPSELSGGEMQRFCIARALGEQTKFLLADEITSMLDMITQSQICLLYTSSTRYGRQLWTESPAAICSWRKTAARLWPPP